jgi:hypothetical protein
LLSALLLLAYLNLLASLLLLAALLLLTSLILLGSLLMLFDGVPPLLASLACYYLELASRLFLGTCLIYYDLAFGVFPAAGILTRIRDNRMVLRIV